MAILNWFLGFLQVFSYCIDNTLICTCISTKPFRDLCCSRVKNGEGGGGGQGNSCSPTLSLAFCTHPIFCTTKRVSADETLAKLASDVGPFTPELTQSILVTPLSVPFPTDLLIHHFSYPIKIENNTWARGISLRVFNQISHYSECSERRNFISPIKHVFFVYYVNTLLSRWSRLYSRFMPFIHR